jgi:hypothetical protein
VLSRRVQVVWKEIKWLELLQICTIFNFGWLLGPASKRKSQSTSWLAGYDRSPHSLRSCWCRHHHAIGSAPRLSLRATSRRLCHGSDSHAVVRQCELRQRAKGVSQVELGQCCATTATLLLKSLRVDGVPFLVPRSLNCSPQVIRQNHICFFKKILFPSSKTKHPAQVLWNRGCCDLCSRLEDQTLDTLKSVIGPFWQGNFRTEVPIREACAVLLARFLLQTASPRSLLIWSEYIAKVNARSTG